MTTATVPKPPPRPAAAPRPAAPAPAAARTPPAVRMSGEKTSGNRLVINGVEGVGKTTLGAYAPEPVFLCSRGETGIDTLTAHGLVPARPVVEIPTWPDCLAMLDSLVCECSFKTVVLDALSGFERLCHEHVCATQFGGDWGEKGFGAYQKGFDLAVTDWVAFLNRLDAIRDKHGATILLLSHCAVRTHKNPLGPDYDRFVSDVHPKTWAVTHKWADAVVFFTFFTVVDVDRSNAKKGKGVGGSSRVMYCERTDAFDAKNRFGLPAVIDIPNEAAKSWDTLAQAMKGGAK